MIRLPLKTAEFVDSRAFRLAPLGVKGLKVAPENRFASGSGAATTCIWNLALQSIYDIIVIIVWIILA
jgi:hypothetical protein